MLVTENGSRVLSYEEWKSLVKMIDRVNDAIADMPSDIDFVGPINYYAMCMWIDTLSGKTDPLADYLPDEDEFDPVETWGKTTVEDWLVEYGKDESV